MPKSSNDYEVKVWLPAFPPEYDGQIPVAEIPTSLIIAQWLIAKADEVKFSPQRYVTDPSHKAIGIAMSQTDITHIIYGSNDNVSKRAEYLLVPMNNLLHSKLSIVGQFETNLFHGTILSSAGRETMMMIMDTSSDGNILHLGMFFGAAFPDSSLTDFMLPTNPITWIVAISKDYIHAAGLFDDDGDIPGRSDGLLFFALGGPLTRDNFFTLKKVFDFFMGVNISYQNKYFVSK